MFTGFGGLSKVNCLFNTFYLKIIAAHTSNNEEMCRNPNAHTSISVDHCISLVNVVSLDIKLKLLLLKNLYIYISVNRPEFHVHTVNSLLQVGLGIVKKKKKQRLVLIPWLIAFFQISSTIRSWHNNYASEHTDNFFTSMFFSCNSYPSSRHLIYGGNQISLTGILDMGMSPTPR